MGIFISDTGVIFMDNTHKRGVLFYLRVVICTLLVLNIAVSLVLSIIHIVKRTFEYDRLSIAGYTSISWAKDYPLNISCYGNPDSSHTIVALSGIGISDFSVSLRPVTDRLADDNLIVFIDRAGYGLSHDTMKKQTTERIVEDYRSALKNAGFEAPYVLLPHSLGGAYATYWESRYPDEIEGIAFLDTTALNEEFLPESKSSLMSNVYPMLCKMGMHRLALKRYFSLLPDSYSIEQKKLSKMLYSYCGYSYAQLSEEKNIKKNCQTALKSIVRNDIPKLYICSSRGFENRDEVKEYVEWSDSIMKKSGLQKIGYSDEDADRTIQNCTKYIDEVIMPYLDRLGNCEFTRLAGSHMIYEQKPDECAEIIRDFIERL